MRLMVRVSKGGRFRGESVPILGLILSGILDHRMSFGFKCDTILHSNHKPKEEDALTSHILL